LTVDCEALKVQRGLPPLVASRKSARTGENFGANPTHRSFHAVTVHDSVEMSCTEKEEEGRMFHMDITHREQYSFAEALEQKSSTVSTRSS
jgi:hypothetical protein